MNDCRLSPRPQADMKIICAGQSDAGMEFTAKYADYNFCLGKGVNTPTACADTVRAHAAGRRQDRPRRRLYVLFMVITGETDEEADGQVGALQGRRRPRGAGLAGRAGERRQDVRPATATCASHRLPKSRSTSTWARWSAPMPTVARMLDEVATMPGTGRRPADLRRFRERHRELRRAHPAADAMPPPRNATREGRRMTQPVSYFPIDDPAARYLPARPEPILIRPAETALIVVDMQNAYASPGGYLDLAGFDISGAAARDRARSARCVDGRARRRHAGDLLPERLGRRLRRGGRAGLAQLAQVQCAEDHARAGPSCRASCWPRAAGTTSWSRRWRRSRATSSSPSPATAPSSTPASTACCARAASATSSSSASPPTSASNRPCATASSSNISA